MAAYVITGANRGIGLELCRTAKERGHKVIAACRTSSSALEALGVEIARGVDVTSDEAATELARRIGDTPIDVLVHSAGILVRDTLDSFDFEKIRHQFEVNTLGPLRITRALLPRLSRGGKIAILTSRMGSIGDNPSGGYYGYRLSKTAVNMAGACLARDLEDRGIAVALLHPGFVRTEMTGGQGDVDPAQSAHDLFARIEELSMETTGRLRHAKGAALPW